MSSALCHMIIIQNKWVCLFFPRDYFQNIKKRKSFFKVGSQMATDDTLWKPAITKSLLLCDVGISPSLLFSFTHRRWPNKSPCEPKLFRHTSNDLLHGHFRLNYAAVSECLQETHAHMSLWISNCWWAPKES